jgi:hypothetical protein
VLLAQGEFLAAQTLADAAKVIATEPAALQLRYLQTLTEIAVEKNSTIIFPLPIDLVEPLTEMLRRGGSNGNGAKPPAPVTPTVPRISLPPAPQGPQTPQNPQTLPPYQP